MAWVPHIFAVELFVNRTFQCGMIWELKLSATNVENRIFSMSFLETNEPSLSFQTIIFPENLIVQHFRS